MKDLNPEQKEAVQATEGPVLVLSGAGTGKTRVLTTRIAAILAQGLAQPWQILAVTFTNKAAQEMRLRLEKMAGADARGVWLGTFHAVGVRILNRYAAQAGLSPNFIVLNTDDQERLVKQIMQGLGIDTKKYVPAIVLDIIQRWKDRGLMPAAVSEQQDASYCDGRARGIYQLYQERLRALNAVDFGDLLLLPLELFKANPDILARYQQQFWYILVDEYQDTNVAQYLLLRLLAKGHGNICCVGDDDQSIYSWRGAQVENILNFAGVFPNTRVIRLERNYRSTAHILGTAAGLIAHNAGRLGKTLTPADQTGADGEKVLVCGVWDGAQEAAQVVESIEQAQAAGVPPGQIAVLVRASFQTRAFEEAFMRAGIPYKIIGGFKFYEREEIRDALAYLRLVVNPRDDLAFERVVNKPRRGIGDKVLEALKETARQKKACLAEAVPWAELRPAARKTLDAFCTLIKQARERAATLDPSPLAQQLLEESGYVAMWRADSSPDAAGRLENLKELYNVLGDFESLKDFIEYTSLLTDTDEKNGQDCVFIMTLHAAKGLEFTQVFLPGWEEGLFPHQRTIDESGKEGLEEERRLAYVGLTRARRKAVISYALNRRVYGQWQNALPSRFLDELPAAHTRHQKHHAERGEARLSWETPPAAPARPSRRVGKRVFHDTFGYGTVIQDEASRLTVHFDEHGVKKVLAKFLEEA